MRRRFTPSVCLAGLLIFVSVVSCSSTENRTEERAKERVTQFIRLMSENRMEDAEKLLSRELLESEVKEFFLDGYDHWKLKDPNLIINVEHVTFDPRGYEDRATVSFFLRNEKMEFVRQGNLPVKFERGDWYIGG